MIPFKLLVATKNVSDLGHFLLRLNLDHNDKKIVQRLLIATVISLNSKEGALSVERASEVIEDILDQLERAQAVDGVPYNQGESK
jgi:hypothetical protein